MAEYAVVFTFADLRDNNRVYRKGDTFPRPGYEPTDERLEELSSNANKIGRPLIEKIAHRGRKRKNEN